VGELQGIRSSMWFGAVGSSPHPTPPRPRCLPNNLHLLGFPSISLEGLWLGRKLGLDVYQGVRRSVRIKQPTGLILLLVEVQTIEGAPDWRYKIDVR